MGHPASGVGEGDVVVARILERQFGSVYMSVSKCESLYNFDLTLVKHTCEI